ncbi:TonB-dependent receptor [candidate division KSB1 bacterium]|nr:TonB-dependent receptor [candidate division KSB1 bacterium]
MKFNNSFIFVLLFAGLINSRVQGGTTGKLVGQVTDVKTGERLPGVNIMIEGTVFGAASDLDGEYLMLMVPPGTYRVTAKMMGYHPQTYEQVRVSIDQTRRLDFHLSEAVLELGKEVTVVAERPLVQMDLTSSEAVINAETISMLPVENFNDVVNLQAGVVEGHFRGGRTGEVMYMIDGIPVNDAYSGNAAFQVENSSISELEVISGTFNAEYGQAMSGVVNIVTKEGGSDYHGQATAYFGDHISSRQDIFWNIDKINPTSNFQLTLEGPVWPLAGDKLSFFATGRFYASDGYLYGKKVFLPSDSSNFQSGPTRTNAWTIMSQGRIYPFSEETAQKLIDGAEAVPMNPSQRLSLQGKLTYKPIASEKLSYEILLENNEFQNYVHEFRLNPDGTYRYFDDGIKHSFSWTHVFSRRTFGTLKFSHFNKNYQQHVLENRFDPGYVSEIRLQDSGANAFLTGGMQMWQFERKTQTSLIKLDLTSQANKNHQLKFGIEYKKHKLWLHEYQVVPEVPDRISPITTFKNNQYTHYPQELSVYFQDKIELDYMIMNAGLRLDYFDPKGAIPQNFQEPDTSPTDAAEKSIQVSPRFGLAYPITDQGKIHVSYGHFFQTPRLDFLYTNPEFDIFELQSTPAPPPNSVLNTIGNANLKPEQTVSYELGLQQQILADYSIDVTVFYKDIRNLLGTEVLYTLTGIRYARYINRDYGNVKGVTLSLKKRQSGGLGASLDYTYQLAKGNASDPNSAYLDSQAGREPTKQMVPLDWDRRHQLNLTLTWTPVQNLTLSLIGRMGTGLPYTPTYQTTRAIIENSARKPMVYNFDLYANRDFKFAGFNLSWFLRIYNLFDQLNELNVYSDTGRATYSLASLSTGGLRPQGINTYDQYITRPDFYSAPREVQVGFELDF